MKHEEHKGKRHHRETGGMNDAAEEEKSKPEDRVNDKKEAHEAEEHKHGGKAEKKEKRAHGGKTEGKKHHKDCKCHKCMGGRAERRRGGHAGKAGFGPENEAVKEHFARGGHAKKHEEHKVEGEHEKHRGDRHPRKSGGRTGADSHPFSSARAGKPAPGRTVENMD